MSPDQIWIASQIRQIFGPENSAQAEALIKYICEDKPLTSKELLATYGSDEKGIRIIQFIHEGAPEIRKLLGKGDKTELFIQRTIEVIDAKYRGTYQIGYGRHHNEKSRAVEIVKHTESLERALSAELTQNFKFRIARSRHDLGLTRPMSHHIGSLLKELRELREALNNELPNMSDVPLPKAKNLDRRAFIGELILAYESIMEEQPGHSPTSRFHQVMLNILPCAGWETNDPSPWIKEARASGWGPGYRP